MKLAEELNKSLKALNSVQVKRLSESATLPTREYLTDAGLDIYAAESQIIQNNETKVIRTDIAVNIPPGYEGTIRPRSGKTSKTALRVQIGTIDAGYIGPIGIICDCHIQEPFYHVQKGDKIAQLVINPVVTPEVQEVIDFSTTGDRGSNGFGSSDKVHP